MSSNYIGIIAPIFRSEFHPEYIFRVLGQWMVSQEAQEVAVENQPIPKLLSESSRSR